MKQRDKHCKQQRLGMPAGRPVVFLASRRAVESKRRSEMEALSVPPALRSFLKTCGYFTLEDIRSIEDEDWRVMEEFTGSRVFPAWRTALRRALRTMDEEKTFSHYHEDAPPKPKVKKAKEAREKREGKRRSSKISAACGVSAFHPLCRYM